jgi:uncharacterized protein with ParB-like and HNH nuclease domain
MQNNFLSFYQEFYLSQKEVKMSAMEEKTYDGDEEAQEVNVNITTYDVTTSPNDFNTRTLNDFIEDGMVKIPGFQRNYVWDKKRASKLIESLIIGIPVPQIFLYEKEKNQFLVIDGQQRYLSIYFFKKMRFPRDEKLVELRDIFNKNNGFPKEILSNNDYFTDFELKLNKDNRFHKKNYDTIEEHDRKAFNIRTIRSIIIKQNAPDDGNSVMFEIFNRLNSGGINLKPQELRTSLYHSDFYEMLYKINLYKNWRKLLPEENPDINMKDVEILLRGFAMLVDHENYTPSFIKFLNKFSSKAKGSSREKGFSSDEISYFESLFTKIVDSLVSIDSRIFFTESGKFSVPIYESIFVAIAEEAYRAKNFEIKIVSKDKINLLKKNKEFINASSVNTGNTNNVQDRIKKAKEIL